MTKLTKSQEKMVKNIKDLGSILISKNSFCFANGKNANARTVRKLVEQGILKDNQDCLFGSGQTLGLAE